ncbi:MAG: hypothetical protein L6437_01825, partial [Kiritimatiellae bacterium]|nr:hypothetical protein [Kiritimatiellia bacterium]
DSRRIAGNVTPVDVRTLAQRSGSVFAVKSARNRKDSPTVSIQYGADKADIDKIKKHIRRPDLAAREVGKYTFDQYLKHEGLR